MWTSEWQTPQCSTRTSTSVPVGVGRRALLALQRLAELGDHLAFHGVLLGLAVGFEGMMFRRLGQRAGLQPQLDDVAVAEEAGRQGLGGEAA